MPGGITSLLKQTGHKEISMLKHYSDHRISGDRERIQKAQIESFGKLLPDYSGHNNVEAKANNACLG